MANTIKDIYSSPDLPGEFFLRPLKGYQGRVTTGTGWQAAAGRIKNLVAYPLLGLLAGVGMLVKLVGIPGVIRHNKQAKNGLQAIKNGIAYAEAYHTDQSYERIQKGWQLQTARQFSVTKTNSQETIPAIAKEIELLTHQFRKIYFQASGQVDPEGGAIAIQLKIRKKA